MTRGASSAWSAEAGDCIFRNKVVSLTPFLGYGIHYQSLYLVDHSGTFAALNSSYKARWSGPFGELRAAIRLTDRLQWKTDLSCHQVSYSANADWNLISSFSHPVSFHHSADGYGVEAHTGLQLRLGRYFSGELGAGYFNWQTGRGIDRLYLATGSSDQTQMNGAFRDGFQVMAGVKFYFIR